MFNTMKTANIWNIIFNLIKQFETLIDTPLIPINRLIELPIYIWKIKKTNLICGQ